MNEINMEYISRQERYLRHLLIVEGMKESSYLGLKQGFQLKKQWQYIGLLL